MAGKRGACTDFSDAQLNLTGSFDVTEEAGRQEVVASKEIEPSTYKKVLSCCASREVPKQPDFMSVNPEKVLEVVLHTFLSQHKICSFAFPKLYVIPRGMHITQKVFWAGSAKVSQTWRMRAFERWCGLVTSLPFCPGQVSYFLFIHLS